MNLWFMRKIRETEANEFTKKICETPYRLFTGKNSKTKRPRRVPLKEGGNERIGSPHTEGGNFPQLLFFLARPWCDRYREPLPGALLWLKPMPVFTENPPPDPFSIFNRVVDFLRCVNPAFIRGVRTNYTIRLGRLTHRWRSIREHFSTNF
mgnify:CR=1 FL=1